MDYVQLDLNGAVLKKINGGVNVAWGTHHFQNADSLTEDERVSFHLYPLIPVERPAFNPLTQGVRELFPLQINGIWTQQWEVYPLPTQIVATNKAAAQVAKWEAIKAHRDKLKEGGVKVGTNWFHSDTFSRTQQLGLVMMGAAVPAIQWKTMDNTFVTMSQTVAMQIFNATAAADANLFGIAEAKRAAMLASEDPAAFDVYSGWPETHV